jgi:hypothetical protein
MNNLIIPDIIHLVETGKIENEYTVLKELEETIIDLYEKNGTSEIFQNELLLLIELEKNNKFNIKIHNELNLTDFKFDKMINDNINNIVLTGPYIRSIFIDNPNYDEIKKEVFINCINNLDPKSLINNSYSETSDLYFKNVNNHCVYIMKKTYKNPSEIILSNYNLKRIGFYKNKTYVSPMFISDYIRFIDSINSNQIDPVFKTKLDLFDIFKHNHTDKEINIFELINKKNFEEYKKAKIQKYDVLFSTSLNTLLTGLNPCEYTIDLFIKEQNDIIKAQLRLIILDLNDKNYLRSPTFYAHILNLDEVDPELFEILKESKQYKTIISEMSNTLKGLNDINTLILSYYIKNDLADEFYNFLKYKDEKSIKIDTNIFNLIIERDPKNIIVTGIKNNFFSERTKYKIILWTQNLDYFNLIGDDFNMDIAVNYINEIVENCFIKSFYFLYKVDSSIISIVDSDNNNILHNIKEKNKFEDMITLLIKLDDSILFKKNKLNQNPLLKHAKDNNFKIVNTLIRLIIENNNETIFESTDNLKNNVLHYLCMKDDVINMIKQIIIIKPDIINYQNKSYETPLIICAKYSQENNLYFLRSMKADMDLVDINGNSVYHYICLNELCIGMDIENKENIFGYKPSDYCKISTNYYYFI